MSDNNWISVNDRMPECGEPVIVCTAEPISKGQNDRVTKSYCNLDGDWIFGDWWAQSNGSLRGAVRHLDVTHWQPLPEPPRD